MESPMWIAIAALICFALFLVGIAILVVNVVTDFLDDKWWISVLIIVLSYIGILLMCNLNKNLLTEPTDKYEYQVTIDDSVSMTKFLEKYEIIKSDGKIYTIREKE